MYTKTGVTLISLVLLLGGCSGGDGSPPAAGGGGGTASADSFTNAVAQAAASRNEDQEPSDQLAQLTATKPEKTESDNL